MALSANYKLPVIIARQGKVMLQATSTSTSTLSLPIKLTGYDNMTSKYKIDENGDYIICPDGLTQAQENVITPVTVCTLTANRMNRTASFYIDDILKTLFTDYVHHYDYYFSTSGYKMMVPNFLCCDLNLFRNVSLPISHKTSSGFTFGDFNVLNARRYYDPYKFHTRMKKIRIYYVGENVVENRIPVSVSYMPREGYSLYSPWDFTCGFADTIYPFLKDLYFTLYLNCKIDYSYKVAFIKKDTFSISGINIASKAEELLASRDLYDYRYFDFYPVPANPFYVRWINSIGDWDYWMFTCRRTKKVSFDKYTEKVTFDTSTSTAATKSTITDAEYSTEITASTGMTDEGEGISDILQSVKVQMWNFDKKNWIDIRLAGGQSMELMEGAPQQEFELTFVVD